MLWLKNINIDGVNMAFVNYFISDEDVEKEIAPIVRTVKNNIGDYLTIADVRMTNPLTIQFELVIRQSEGELDFELVLNELQNIHDKVNGSISAHISDYSVVFDGCTFKLFYNSESILELKSNVDVEEKEFYDVLNIYSPVALNSVNILNLNCTYLYNETEKSIPGNWYDNFLNLYGLRTYINTDEDLQCISKLSNLKYACLVIKNNNVDLSCLSGCESIGNIDLYLLKMLIY